MAEAFLNPYPPTGFNFLVTFQGFKGLPSADSWFQEVSGLKMDMETEAYTQAGRRYPQHLPVRTNYSTLSLKRGLYAHSLIIQWVRLAMEELKVYPATIVIQLMNANKIPLASWQVYEAIPVSWSVGSLNAESSNILIESLELKYEMFRFIPLYPNAD